MDRHGNFTLPNEANPGGAPLGKSIPSGERCGKRKAGYECYYQYTVTSAGTFSLTPGDRAAYEKAVADWHLGDKVKRLWAKDASLWSNADEAKWLGWLDIAAVQLKRAAEFREIARQVQERKYSHVLLLGMGGSSLCPEVLALSFGRIAGFPELHVLD